MLVSLFSDLYNAPHSEITIDQAIERIKSGHNIKHIEKLRQAHNEGNKGLKEYIKKNDLWAVTFAGTFEQRKKDKLKESSELLILDFDHVPNPEFFKRYHFDNFDHVFAAWISPSGDGVKILIRIPKVNSDDEYKLYYNSVLKHFDNAQADQATKDICRLCFESYDPNLLQRDFEKVSIWESKEKEYIEPTQKVKIEHHNSSKDATKLLDIASSMISNSVEGNKHYTLLKAARLLGGYIATNAIIEDEAIKILETAIQKKDISNFEHAKKTIISGINYGKLSPITHDFQEQYEQIKTLEFPVQVFPEMYQALIDKLYENLNFPKDYTATSILFAFSVLMGNKFSVLVKTGYITVPICWFGIVGEPGVTKSHPVNKILTPIKDWDYNSFKDYKLKLKDWELVENNTEPKPRFKKHLIDDFTTEALANIIGANNNGVGIYADELASWVHNLDRYSNGNNMSKFLSIYDNGNLIIDRKTQEPEYVKKVFLSIIGTVQPEILIDMFDKYSGNGFIDRFLFAYPDAEIKPLSIFDIDIEELEQHNELMHDMIGAFEPFQEQVYKFENLQDYIRINQWLIEKAKSQNTNIRMVNYISKLISYIPRLGIIIETINSIVTNDTTPSLITTNSMLKTFDLIKYFYVCAEKLLVDINKKKDAKTIINGYKFNYEKVQALRKADYKYKDIGKLLGISEQTAKNYSKKVPKNEQ